MWNWVWNSGPRLQTDVEIKMTYKRKIVFGNHAAVIVAQQCPARECYTQTSQMRVQLHG